MAISLGYLSYYEKSPSFQLRLGSKESLNILNKLIMTIHGLFGHTKTS